jgi:DHA1 family bicyclomycin/chloramphenicol resistance-like MFS transporter
MSVPLGLVVAPIIGGYTAIHWGWRYNFWVLGIIQIFLIIIIGLFTPDKKANISGNQEHKSFFNKKILFQVFCNKKFVLYSMLLAFVNAPYMVFITHSSFLYLKHWEVSTKFFAVSHSLLAVLYFLSLFIFRIVLKRTTIERLVNIGMIMFCCFGITIFMYCTEKITHTPINLLMIMYFSCLASGFVIAGSTVLAMQSSTSLLYGTYAAFLGMAESGIAAIFMIASGYHDGAIESSMLLYISISTAISLLIWAMLLVKQKRKISLPLV